MRFFLIFVIVFSSLSFAVDNNKSEKLLEQQVKEQMEREKKYAREQTFYNMNNYDFKGAEVNKESLSTVNEIEVDDFNIDSVYD